MKNSGNSSSRSNSPSVKGSLAKERVAATVSSEKKKHQSHHAIKSIAFASAWRPVSEEELGRLKDHYKYSCIDKSLLTKYLLTPYWEWILNNLIPLWMAPNLITLTGLLFVVTAYAVALWYSPALEAYKLPSWTYFVFAAATWINATLDSIDGKQARRTASASPLGEILDHSMDSINLVLMAPITMLIFGFQPGWQTAILSVFAYFVFYVAAWETYHTKTLYLGYISGPVEGTAFLTACSIISGVYGVKYWENTLGAVLPSTASLQLGSLAEMQMRNLSLLIYGICCAIGIASSFKHVLKKAHSCKAFLQLFPISIVFILGWLWCSYNPELLWGLNHTLFLAVMGFAFNDTVLSVITAHVTKSPYPLLGLGSTPIVLRAVLQVGSAFLGIPIEPWFDRQYMISSLQFTLLIFLVRMSRTVKLFCDHLKIDCFRIPLMKQKQS